MNYTLAPMMTVVLAVDDYIGRHRRRVIAALAAVALAGACLAAWGLSLSEALRALPL